MTLRVVHFQRRPCVGLHSIEMLFDALRGALAAEAAGRAAVEKAVAPEYSQGLRPRLANVRWAAARQGDVNHVTGDVHFLALGLDGPRTVLTVHDCYALERLRGVRRWLLKRYWFDLPVERVAAVTAISEATRRELVRQVPAAEGKTVVIPNAVSPAF
ncbi:MAG TPA: glycosyltransferase, partial [Lacipirellulaceae bacterium]|nr:glycosyltransferase [Lacipirellulaceae bacterium]